MTAVVQAQVERAKALAIAGQVEPALALLAELTAGPDVPWQALWTHADVLKKAGRLKESLELSRRLIVVRPQSVPARHNLASTLGDLGRAVEAERVCREAMALGGGAPETWLVLARALQSQNRFDEAEVAYDQALSRRPGYPDALRDLSQLIWMQRADLDEACAPLNSAIAAAEPAPVLRQIKAKLLEYAGQPLAAYQTVISVAQDWAGEIVAAQAIIGLDPSQALAHAKRAAALAGVPVVNVQLTQVECLLALGDHRAALVYIEALLRAAPFNQHVLAHLATAWRMSGNPRYAELYDYAAFVRPYRLETPSGWPSLEAYLVDLAQALNGLHRLKTHPVGQSLRGGTQTTAMLSESEDPAIVAFFQAVDGPIRAYMAAVGQGGDPLRSRNTGRYDLQGAWSVRLRPNGFHADHVHPNGWLSSACHIELPAAVDGGAYEGWLRFGAPPGLAELPPEHYVRPQPGTLVLFPSYMWHGTTLFSGDASRLTLAFDVVPA